MATLVPSAASGAVVLTFDQTGASSGSISYAGGATPAVGTDIMYNIISVNDGINPEYSLDCNGCELDFTTGNATSAIASLVQYSGGGSFVITGSITDPNNGDALVASGVLLTGSFSGPLPALASRGQDNQVSVSGTGLDTKNDDLEDYLGIANGQWIFATSVISELDCDTNIANGFNCLVEEADTVNTEIVPEPGTLALFGLGLLGAGSAIRRRIAALS